MIFCDILEPLPAFLNMENMHEHPLAQQPAIDNTHRTAVRAVCMIKAVFRVCLYIIETRAGYVYSVFIYVRHVGRLCSYVSQKQRPSCVYSVIYDRNSGGLC